MIYKFNDVTERDMDMLFLEEMASSKPFLDIFTSKIGITDATVVETEISKVSVEYGESDMTVILAVNGRKHALLFEDKIDAVAMPNQCERYFSRGDRCISNGEYESFDVFIVAPLKYLETNREASKYPHSVSYEECADFFSCRQDERYQFKYQQIMFAIQKQKRGYQVVENTAVTNFWDKYITYQEKNYPDLWLVSKRGVRGSKASWPHYNTVIDGIFIFHKSEFGFCDLTIPNGADNIVSIEYKLKKAGINLADNKMALVKTGKSAAIRLTVPILDFSKPFDDYTKEIRECFEALNVLTALAKEISKVNLITK